MTQYYGTHPNERTASHALAMYHGPMTNGHIVFDCVGVAGITMDNCSVLDVHPVADGNGRHVTTDHGRSADFVNHGRSAPESSRVLLMAFGGAVPVRGTTAIVESDAFDSQIDALCGRVATYAPLTIQATKEAVRRIVTRSWVDGDDLLLRAYGSNDFREGVAAFIEKRAPQWEGR